MNDSGGGLLRRFARGLLAWTVGLILVFEEWGWDALQAALAALGRLPVLRRIERFVGTLPPYAALALFAAPTLSLLPVKLAALWLIAHHHAVLGLVVVVAAKVVGTAVVARLFVLTRPALMSLPWFARLHDRFTAWKQALLERVRTSWPWRLGRLLRRRLGRRVRRFFGSGGEG